MSWKRPPAVAGMFYPGDAQTLAGQVESFLDEVDSLGDGTAPGFDLPKALVAPHAGYVYSGPVAASGYARLRGLAATVTRVVLLGPAHRHPFQGLAASTAEAFLTPLGLVPLDHDTIGNALEHPSVQYLDEAHEGEHSLEVHLPFLQQVLRDFLLVPFVVGDASPRQVAEVLKLVWGGSDTLIVVSSDLSHYRSYREAQEIDGLTAQAIESLDAEKIGFDQACGRIPLGGLLVRAREEGLRIERVDLRNSGDTAGSKDRVVGYGSWVLT